MTCSRAAEAGNVYCPGGVIVESTAGNTGIGLALVANARGYRTVIVIPDTQSQEKKDALRHYGADLREVPAVPCANPNNYVKDSGRLVEEIAQREPAGAISADQFDNVANGRTRRLFGNHPLRAYQECRRHRAPAATTV